MSKRDLEVLFNGKGDYISSLVAEKDHYKADSEHFKALCENAGIL
jgi:hypothetical protein